MSYKQNGEKLYKMFCDQAEAGGYPEGYLSFYDIHETKQDYGFY